MKDTILLLDLAFTNRLSTSLKQILSRSRFRVERASVDSRNSAWASALPRASLVILVLSSGSLDQAMDLIGTVKTQRSSLPIFVAIDSVDPDRLFDMLKAGVADFVTPPFEAVDVLPRIWRALERVHSSAAPINSLKEHIGLKQIIGQSPCFLAELRKFPMLAKCDVSILILGETGTGKELCARAIHYLSPRSGNPFVPVNCGAVPGDLVENELFGHEREAFTGARTSRAGLVREADSGTLFLDEIDCLPLAAQVKLLRFLQEKEYRPLGSARMRKADVRVMAASNADLEQAVAGGRVRQDLYYRLNVLSVALPPLRERREDIPILARYFLSKYAREFERPATNFSPSGMQALLLHDWPGNVRELEHVVERAVVLSDNEIVDDRTIQLHHSPAKADTSFQKEKARVVAQFEKRYLKALLLAHSGNVTRAARAAGKDGRALRQLIRKHKIDLTTFRGT